MALLDKHSMDMGGSASRLFDAVYSHDTAPAPRGGIYRCMCCGEEIAFDSLVADCRCSEECFAETNPVSLH